MLPVDEVLPELAAALARGAGAVLVAPPGAGKTTRVPLALLDAPWRAGGRILVLEPRRIAARAAARFTASLLGEPVGRRVGYRVRLERRVSAETRVEFLTEGVFTAMVLADPGLEGVAAAIFDEFHERSLEADLGLALALDVQAALRPDLRILVMSATLDGGRVAGLLGGVPVVESRGRAFPVETRHVETAGRRVEEEVAAAVLAALRAEAGSLLAFLPGQAEIRRTASLLDGRLPPDAELAPLYGALDASEQDRAIRPAPPGRRKVVLATAIAETSLTIEGVRVVIDSGLARVPVYEPATGLTRLVTRRVSRASADQRRGRAGRTGPGVCYRLWPERLTLAPAEEPEIRQADLAPLALALASWGVADPAQLRWLDPPPAPAWKEARALLAELDALDADGRLTGEGRALAALSLPPRLGHMLRRAAAAGEGGLAGEIAALLSERGLGGTDTDLRERLRRFRGERGGRADEARRLAVRWAREAGAERQEGEGDAERAGAVLALAFPERIAMARGAPGGFVLANGRGGRLDPADALAREPFLAVAEMQGEAENARILLAAPIGREEIAADFAGRIVEETVVAFDAGRGAVRARRLRRLGRVVLADEAAADAPPEAVAAALVAGIGGLGLSALPWSAAATQLAARLAFLRRHCGDPWPAADPASLLAGLGGWLGPHLAGKRRLADIGEGDVLEALRALVPWQERAALDRLAPSHWQAPTGSRHPVGYADPEAPSVSLRVQELFGLDRHPAVLDGRLPLTLDLLSPGHRTIQVTRDLPGFWRGSWKAVRSELRGRYPKHPWPEDPLSAPPTTRAKPRGNPRGT